MIKIKKMFFAAVICVGLLALNNHAFAQDGGWKAPKEEKQKPDPCAKERSEYPWGMGPCRIEKLQQQNAQNKSVSELREDQNKLQRRTEHNKNVIMKNK